MRRQLAYCAIPTFRRLRLKAGRAPPLRGACKRPRSQFSFYRTLGIVLVRQATLLGHFYHCTTSRSIRPTKRLSAWRLPPQGSPGSRGLFKSLFIIAVVTHWAVACVYVWSSTHMCFFDCLRECVCVRNWKANRKPPALPHSSHRGRSRQ